MKYNHYLVFLTPLGPGSTFWKSDSHPLSKQGYSEFQQDIAGKLTRQSNQAIQPGMIFITFLHELPEELAEELSKPDPKFLRLMKLPDGTLARADGKTGLLIDPPFGKIPEDAELVKAGEELACWEPAPEGLTNE